MPPIPTIRLATEADLPAVRRLLVETWHATFDSLLGPARVTGITNAWHAIPALRAQIDQPGCSFLVAELDGELIGHTSTHEQPDQWLYIGRLYVHPTHQRRGLGKQLLAAALACHPGSTRAWLRVAADNHPAVAFYQREGFATAHETTDPDGLRELRMEKPIQ